MKKLFMKGTLTILSIFLIPVILLSSAVLSFFIWHEASEYRRSLVNEGRLFAKLLAVSYGSGAYERNRDVLKGEVNEILMQSNVLSVAIYAADNRVIFNGSKRSLEGGYGNPQGFRENVNIQESHGDLSQTVWESVDGIEIISPIFRKSFPDSSRDLLFAHTPRASHEKIIGHVKVVLNKNVLVQETRIILVKYVVIAFIFVFACCVYAYVALQNIIKPSGHLTGDTKSTLMERILRSVSAESTSEVERLSQDLSTLTETLIRKDEEKHQLEEKLRHAQKMEIFGKLARGIAHDFNNILTTIRGSLYMIEKGLHHDHPLRQYTEQALRSIVKTKQLIISLSIFSRTQKMHSIVFDMNSLVNRQKPLLYGVAGEGISIVFTLYDEQIPVYADPLQIEQILLNICTNARDAMPAGGIIYISTGIVPSSEIDRADVSAEMKKYALLSVSDNGVGMTEDIKDRIFEPFFTTKEPDRGRGLGLTIVFGIIDQLNGYIEVKSKKDEGSEFTVYLPVCGVLPETRENHWEAFQEKGVSDG